MNILGIESSCDETAVAIVRDNKILANIVASQDEIHAKYGGVVPELASRKHVEVIHTLLKEAFIQAEMAINEIDGIAVTKAPGLIGAVLVGLSTAKSIAFSLEKPLIGVNHLEGHINAPFLEDPNIPYPHIGLIVSGGHTSLYLVKEFGHYKLLGATRDDAAGEAFDKVARLLELGYPGGPIIDKLSQKGNANAFKFPMPKFRDASLFDFSFSGLKTAVMHQFKKLVKENKLTDQTKLDLIASFQKTAIEMLVKNLIKAAKEYKCKNILISGGVAANKGLRERLKAVDNEYGFTTHIPPLKLCTDNAAMIAYVGAKRLSLGEKDSLDLNAEAVKEIGI